MTIKWKSAQFYAANENYGFDVKLMEGDPHEPDEWCWRVYEGKSDSYIHFGYADTAAKAKADCLRSVE